MYRFNFIIQYFHSDCNISSQSGNEQGPNSTRFTIPQTTLESPRTFYTNQLGPTYCIDYDSRLVTFTSSEYSCQQLNIIFRAVFRNAVPRRIAHSHLTVIHGLSEDATVRLSRSVADAELPPVSDDRPIEKPMEAATMATTETEAAGCSLGSLQRKKPVTISVVRWHPYACCLMHGGWLLE